jgi:hypothetical protein
MSKKGDYITSIEYAPFLTSPPPVAGPSLKANISKRGSREGSDAHLCPRRMPALLIKFLVADQCSLALTLWWHSAVLLVSLAGVWWLAWAVASPTSSDSASGQHNVSAPIISGSQVPNRPAKHAEATQHSVYHKRNEMHSGELQFRHKGFSHMTGSGRRLRVTAFFSHHCPH